MQSCLSAFARAYPNVALHLWVDERRRTSRASAWSHLKKYALYDWLDAIPYIAKVYRETYSPALLRASVRAAQAENYPIVISLAVLERHWYAALARRIGPRAFVVGQQKKVRPYNVLKYLSYRKLDAAIPAYTKHNSAGKHVSELYASWFQAMFGIHISADERFPTLDIPDRWKRYAHNQFTSWSFIGGANSVSEVVFVNGFSKSVERSWPLVRVIELVQAMQNSARWRGAGFVINVIPEEIEHARAALGKYDLSRTYLFSAQDNFFNCRLCWNCLTSSLRSRPLSCIWQMPWVYLSLH